VPRARTPERVPVVLSRDEVRQVMNRLGRTSWLAVALLYGAGLRRLQPTTWSRFNLVTAEAPSL